MRLRDRLQRLERAAVVRRTVVPPRDLSAEIEQGLAYLCGERPPPPNRPCPPWFDPAEWASRQRVGHCLVARASGELAADTYLPGRDAAERNYLDGLTEAVAVFARYARPPGGPGPAGGGRS